MVRTKFKITTYKIKFKTSFTFDTESSGDREASTTIRTLK